MSSKWSKLIQVANSTYIYKYDSFEKIRLDVYLTDQHPKQSRNRIQKWITGGAVTVNGKLITKTGYTLELGYEVVLNPPDPLPTQILAEEINLDVIFEDDDLLVINKPAGMVVHPGAGHASGTIVNAALAHSPEMEGIGGEGRPGIVHRLDKDTSGILLLAKNDFTHRLLQEQFKQREIHKVYIALVDGRPPTPEGIIEGAIGRDPNHRKQMAVMHNDRGRDATSRYLTLKEFTNHTLLEIHPVTGRTHQIRLHLAFIGCPITGDRVYGYKKPSLDISRHFLHAEKITLHLPRTKLLRTFEAPLPGDLNQILDNLI